MVLPETAFRRPIDMIHRLPSTDLYFRNACGDFLQKWFRRGPIMQVGHNSFISGRTFLLIRQDEEPLMRRALEWRGDLVYVIDDDIAGAAHSPELPPSYRTRLEHFNVRYNRNLLKRADTLLVPCERLAQIFASDSAISARIRPITPYWNLQVPQDTNHFKDIDGGQPIRLIHLGSASHIGSLTALAPAIANVLDQKSNMMFTYFAREAIHPQLAKNPRVRQIAPMGWSRYQRWISRQRFHLAFYPLDDSPFDRARSTNKLIEHAIVGAVGVYPENWAPAKLLTGAAIMAPSEPSKWSKIIQEAVADPERLVALAGTAASRMHAYNDRSAQRQLWRSIFNIGLI